MTIQPQYAFFDFDGTLIAEDSFQFLIKSSLKAAPWRIFLFPPALFMGIVLSPFFKFDKTPLKSALLWSITFGKSKRQCAQFLNTVAKRDLVKIFFQNARDVFKSLHQKKIEVVVISASGCAWIRPTLAAYGLPCRMIMGTRLGFFWGGMIFTSKNCYHKEKLLRIQETLGSDFIWHSSWSDHPADIPLLKAAPPHERYLICPKLKHMDTFHVTLKTDFHVLQWTTPPKKIN